jgi:hypothetical protein
MDQLIRLRECLSGVVMGLASIAVKVLAGLFAPVVWLGARRRFGWAIGFSLTVVLAFVPLAATGGNVLFPLQNQGKATSSGNLPFLMSATGLDIVRHSAFLNAVGVSVLIATLVLAYRRYSSCRDPWRLIPWISFMAFLLVFCSKKAGAYYLCTAFFPICITIADAERGRLRSIIYVLFSVASSLDLSLWFRWLHTSPLGFIRHWVMPPGLASWKLAVFLTNDVLLVACCAWYLGQSWRLLGARTGTVKRDMAASSGA